VVAIVIFGTITTVAIVNVCRPMQLAPSLTLCTRQCRHGTNRLAFYLALGGCVT
jgi:hypothetical protein